MKPFSSRPGIAALAAGLIVLATDGCATQYGVRAELEGAVRPSLACAINALQAQGFKVSHESQEQVGVSLKDNVANLYVSGNDFELAKTSFHGPMSCAAIQSSAPFLRQVIAVIQQQCIDNLEAGVAEVWNQDSCGVSIADGGSGGLEMAHNAPVVKP